MPPSPQSRSYGLPLLYLLGFVILAGAIVWMWQNPPQPRQLVDLDLQQRVSVLESRLAQLDARVSETRAEPTAVAAPVSPGPISSGPAADAEPRFDPAPLIARIGALEARPAPPPPPPPPAVDLAPIEARLAGLEARPAAGPADKALSERVARLAAIQAAGAALEAGHKLGELPGAPPTLQRFAETAPPTEAALRLSFPAASRLALRASRPIDPDQPWLSRIWARLQSLVTIRQDDRVLVGDPAAGVIAEARQRLDAGDLAGTIAVLGKLNPPAAQAMSGWIGQAKSLQEARAALADMAAHG